MIFIGLAALRLFRQPRTGTAQQELLAAHRVGRTRAPGRAHRGSPAQHVGHPEQTAPRPRTSRGAAHAPRAGGGRSR
jgi:hypothetical protein